MGTLVYLAHSCHGRRSRKVFSSVVIPGDRGSLHTHPARNGSVSWRSGLERDFFRISCLYFNGWRLSRGLLTSVGVHEEPGDQLCYQPRGLPNTGVSGMEYF